MVLSKEVADSIRNCIISVFWRKSDVLDFFLRAGCSNADVCEAKEYDKLSLTKRGMVDRVLQRLQNRPDGAVLPIRNIIRELVEWSTFDSHDFGPGGSLNLEIAKEAIRHLREIQSRYDGRKKEEVAERKKKEEELKAKHSLAEIHRRFILLHKCIDESGKVINVQKRGYLFEALLRDLFQFEGLNLNEKFQLSTTGEQIDGSLKYDGENYILEAKWQDDLIASSALYHFAFKVEGKMYGRGIFISLNGFSSDSVHALRQGKSTKSVLIDGADLILVMEGRLSFSEILDRKVRAAQTLGQIYIDPYSLKEK